MKKFLSLLTVSVILFTFFSCASTAKTEKSESEEEIKAPEIVEKKDTQKKSNKPSEKIITENEYYLEAELKIPVFKGYDLLNSYIENSQLNYYKSFKINSKADYDELLKERTEDYPDYVMNKFIFDTTYDYSVTDTYISVIVQTWIYEGGAHGNSSYQAFCYNKQTSSFEYDLETLTGHTYDEIASICQHELVKNYGDQTNFDWIMDGTSNPAAFEYFLVKDKTVDILFEEYSVGPYSMGSPVVQIPRK